MESLVKSNAVPSRFQVGSSCSLPEFRKRACEDAFGDACALGAKRSRFHYHFVLESESELPTDEDSESEHSIQGKETDYAKDTSDTTSHSDWSDSSSSVRVEYELASTSSNQHSFDSGSMSSGTEDLMDTAGVIAAVIDDDLGLFADTSDSESDPVFDPEVPRRDYWSCVQCKNRNNNPLFRYCEKCFRLRKDFLPPRPRHRRSRKKKSCSPCRSDISSLAKSSSELTADSGLAKSASDLAAECGLVKSTSDLTTDSGLTESASDLTAESGLMRSASDLAGDSELMGSASDLPGNSGLTRSASDLSGNSDLTKSTSDLPQDSELTRSAADLPGNNVLKRSISGLPGGSGLTRSASDLPGGSGLTSTTSDLPGNSVLMCVSDLPGSSVLTRSASDLPGNSVLMSVSDLTVDRGLKKSVSESVLGGSGLTNRNFDSTIDRTMPYPPSSTSLQALDQSEGPEMCITCLARPKNGIFVHSKIGHICCCYKCALKVWKGIGRCPLCHGRIKNVLQAFIR